MITFRPFNVPLKYSRNGTIKKSLNVLIIFKDYKTKDNFQEKKRMNFPLKRPMEPKISGEILENLYFQTFRSKLISNQSELFADFLSKRINKHLNLIDYNY